MVQQLAKESKAKKPAKTVKRSCTLLSRKENQDGSVNYQIKNGGGFKYNIVLRPNGSAFCNQAEDGEPCPSSRSGYTCYHIKYVVEIEALHKQISTPNTIPAPKPVVKETPKPIIDTCMPKNVTLYNSVPTGQFCHGRHWADGYCHYGAHYIN